MTTPTPAPAGVPLYTDEYLDGEKHRHIDMLHSGARTYMDWDCITLLLAKEMRDSYEAELAKLRRQLAAQWTPIQDTEKVSDEEYREHEDWLYIDGDYLRITSHKDHSASVYLPPHIRLCSKPKEQAQD